MIQQMTLDDRKIFPDIFHPVSLPTEEPLWVLFDWSAISLDIQLRSVPYFTTNNVQSRCKTRCNCPSPAGMRSLRALLLPLSTGVRLFEVPVGIYGA